MTIFILAIIQCVFFVGLGCLGIGIKFKEPDYKLSGVFKWIPTAGIGLVYFMNIMNGYISFNIFNNIIIAGFIFCTIGDYFLKLKKDSFTQGLIGFFIGYTLFTVALFLRFNFTTPWIIFTLIVFIVNGIQFKTMKLPKDMVIPIILYLILQTALVSSGFNALQINKLTGVFQFLATMFIFISDSFIGHNLFRKKMSILTEQLGVDLLYFIGISLLTIGPLL